MTFWSVLGAYLYPEPLEIGSVFNPDYARRSDRLFFPEFVFFLKPTNAIFLPFVYARVS